MTTVDMSEEGQARRAGFSNPDSAFRIREAMRTIVKEELGKIGPDQQVARCMSIDLGKLRATVWVPGDPDPISVNIFPHMIPNDAQEQREVYGEPTTSAVGPGAVVIIENIRSQPYITYVMSGGNFAYRLSAAGLQHKVFSAVHRKFGEVEVTNIPTVQGVFGSAVSIFLQSFTEYGNAAMIGPFTSVNSNGLQDGTIKVTIARNVNSWEYEFSIGADMEDDFLYPGDAPTEKWLRVLPKHASTWLISSPSEVALDVGYRTTTYRAVNGYEFWLRISSMIPDETPGSTYIHVNSSGPFINFGEYTTGKMLVEEQVPMTAIQGVLGQHQGHGSNEGSNGMRFRDDHANSANASSGPEPRYGGAKINQGPWLDAALRVAQDVQPLWGCNGHFTWDGSGVGWTGDLIFTGIGPSLDGLVEGRLNLPMPANGTRIGVYPSNPFGTMASATALVGSGKIPLAAGQTLYAIIPNYIGNGGVSGYVNWMDKNFLFMIVDNETFDAPDHHFKLPAWTVPIVHRSYSNTDPRELKVLSPNVELIDSTQYQSVVSTATVSARANTTANVLLTLPSMVFKNNCAYRVRFKTVYRGSTTNSWVQFLLKKGTTSSGSLWGDLGKWGVDATAQNHMAYCEAYLCNTSGAAITTQVVVTDESSAASVVSFNADTLSRRFLEIEYCGPAAKYANQGNVIT